MFMIDTIRNFPITILSPLKFSLSFFLIFILSQDIHFYFKLLTNKNFVFVIQLCYNFISSCKFEKGTLLKFFQKFTRLLLQDAYLKNYPTRKSTNIPNLFKKPIQDGAWSSNEISSIFAFLYLAATTTRHNCVWSRNLSARRINLERNLY